MVAHIIETSLGNNLRYAETILPTPCGEFRCIVYHLQDGLEHIALVKGEVSSTTPILCRLQSECLTGEVFGSEKCDCKRQLDMAMARIAQEGSGVLLYLRQEGRGIGLGNKIKAYNLQMQGIDTVDANRILGFPDDGREFCCAIHILRDLNIASVRLLTNNPHKVDALVQAGIHVAERLPHQVSVSSHAQDYMKAKSQRMGHFIEHVRNE